jgi:hypothetical protein
MSIKNFKFVSPGVFINEIDNSFRPRSPDAIGPVVVGRARRGIAGEPISIDSFSEYVDMFGDTVPGMGGGDIYRHGNLQSPMYGTYAAKAFLRSNVAPLTYMRLLGQQTTTNDGSLAGRAGWNTDNTLAADTSTDETAPDSGGAFGLFLFASGSTAAEDMGIKATATLTVADAGQITTTNQISLITADSKTVTITGHGSANAMTTTSGASSDGTFDASTASGTSSDNIAQALAIATCINLHDDFTATTGGTAVVTVTQNTVGTAGNTTVTAAKNGGAGDIAADDLVIVSFTGGSDAGDAGNLGTGSCAAIWYLQNGKIQLSGNLVGGADVATASAGAFIGSDSGGNYKVLIKSATQGQETFLFNFNDNSENFIRNQFNTNPQLHSSGNYYPSAAEKDYWLGETFEQDVRERGLQAGAGIGIILGLGSGSTAGSSVGPHLMKGQAAREAVAGWFISQDVGEATAYEADKMQKLFRLKGRGHGEWLHKNLKVSIERVRQSNSQLDDYGTFSVVLRKLMDTDSNVQVVERYDNCNLDPRSPNFVARKIGDRYAEWDETNQRLRYYGEYPNNSRYVYAEMNDDVEAGATEASLLPFGYFGPPVMSGSSDVLTTTDPDTDTIHKTMLAWSGSYGGFAGATGLAFDSAELLGGEGNNLTASFKFPSALLRLSASDGGLTDSTKAYFGFRTTRTATSNNSDPSVADLHRLIHSGFPDDPTSGANAAGFGVIEYSHVFSLDDIRKTDATSDASYYYESGSRSNNVSVTAESSSYKILLDANYNRFTAPFWGGFDGFDITKPDPLANSLMSGTPTEDNNYAFHTIRRALTTVSDPDLLDFNLLTTPGLTNDSLTGYSVQLCEDRADALALIDLANVYTPTHEEYKTKNNRPAKDPLATANALKDRRLDSSYGATFYPWVQTRDAGTGQLVWIPPTVAMMGVLGSSEAVSDIWFAPAGFNRGGLTEGAAGIPVSNVSERLSSRERDILYDARINPIASFPSNGIVVLGQKTLQERPSALDRINVRRLVIYLKKQISILSTQILFEQNVQDTWDRFKGLIEPFLANVKTRFGITDYRLILDETTTTPDLIDQNILYAKIMVKPARAIEFIAIDFVIASTGASFDD